MILKPDCLHFPGDRPCDFHKKTGVKCDNCSEYAPIGARILVIKFDALGDVLRTTSLLPSLIKAYPAAHVTWLTKANAVDLFVNNPMVHEVWWMEDPQIVAKLLSVEFDLVVHPDANPSSAKYASMVRAKIFKGFRCESNGRVCPVDGPSEEWFELGAFDDLKKKNTKTYQQIIHDIAGIPYDRSEIVLRLSSEELAFAGSFRARYKLGGFRNVIGLNTGAGGRWTYKKWTLDGYRGLVKELINRESTAVLLFGGPEETERNRALSSMSPKVIDTGTNNSLRQFFALMSLPSVVVTGDTMALHVATALKKPTICLFGPTSANEIEDYGRVVKIQPALDCLVCYKMDCDFQPNCMDSISVADVLNAIHAVSTRNVQ